MNDDQQTHSPEEPQRSISEIGHLFLSSVRDRHTGGQRPNRVPPAARQDPPRESSRPQASIDLTPEEYAQVFGAAEAVLRGGEERMGEARVPPVSALITVHLNGAANDRIRQYARHLAANGERIGILEIDGSDLRLLRYERSIEPNESDPQPAEITERFDHRFMAEALEEMGWDIDRWLLVLPSLRSPEARGLLKEVDHWAVLSTCDHDGVVSCYRTLKGLSGGLNESRRPKLTLALLDAASEAVAAKVCRKLSSVCLQFLGIELKSESTVRPTRAVAEHVVLHCRSARDKAQLAAGAQWLVVEEFLARARAQAAEQALREAERDEAEPPLLETIDPQAEISQLRAEISGLKSEIASLNAPSTADSSFGASNSPTDETPGLPDSPMRDAFNDMTPMHDLTARGPMMDDHSAPRLEPAGAAAADEVIDLRGDEATEQAVVAAVLSGAGGELIECPVRAPMCPDARLAVTRDRGLVLLAVARKGLRELRLIAQAYRWAIENRALIAMAVPQLAIDAHRHPKLTLIVDHADASAEVLAPMLENDCVSVRAYRKLRWGNRTGLLLEAA